MNVPEEAEDNFEFDTSADTVCHHMVSDYFYPVIGTNAICTKVMYDVDLAETDVFADATSMTYTITLQRRITGTSFTSISGVTDGGAAITFKYPALESIEGESPVAVSSSDPFGGYFTIECDDPDTSETLST